MTYISGNKEFYLEVAKKNIPSHKAVSKFGSNPIIDISDGFATVWDGSGTYVVPTQARIHDVVSDNTADAGTVLSSGTATGGSVTTIEDTGATFIADGVAVGDIVLNDDKVIAGRVTSVTSETVLTFIGGVRELDQGLPADGFESGTNYRVVTDASTGASLFYILGLDSNFLEIREFIVLNGTTIVPTTKSFLRQYRARTFTSGAGGTAGLLTSTAQTDGTITCQIDDGSNQSLMSVYTVPSDKTAYLINWWGSLSKKQAAASVLNLRIGEIGGVSYITQVRGLNSVGSSDFNYLYTIPLVVVGTLDIWVEANTDTNGLSVGSGFDILLVDN